MEPDLVQRALRAPGFPEVRRRVFRQLLESLLYENAVRAHENDDGRSVVAAVSDEGEPVRYVVTARRRFGFGRVAVTGPVLRTDSGGIAEAESLSGFLGEARAALDADPELLTRFARELEETLVKDAAAQYVRVRRGGRLADASYDELEGRITDGHRYHPTFKSRMGFDAADNYAYGPEFAHPVHPLWIAAHNEISEVSTSSTLSGQDFVRGQLGATKTEHFLDILREAGAEPADFTLVPVHPWQWREQVATAFAEPLRQGSLHLLGPDPDEFLPQQSIRTMACVTTPHRPYLKLALSIVNTSTSRVLAPHTVRNAAPISDWLRDVVESDPFLRDDCRVVLLGEVQGSAVVPDQPGGLLREDTYGVLSCIWRESLYPHVEPGENAVPFTGLTARELDGTPMIEHWVRKQGVIGWLDRLVEVSVVPLLHLLCRHGIALESHAQNMVLLHRGGVPERVVLRDFHDGVRFSRAHLAEPDRCPELAGTPAHHGNRNSFVETDDLDLVTDFLLDAFFFINLGELSIFLADTYGLAEREFWKVVRARVAAYQEAFPELTGRFTLFDLAKPTIAVERLTTRRLLPDTELRLHSVPNPLAGP
ncbi:IucA/IucC family protein [Amycolatopsis marina]|nr:IucA/IucC family protein [Amycolatopsis marina]